MARRTARDSAAFFLPYVKAGMRLLDAGCGAGSITLGLAEVVRPAEATGVDLNAEQIQRAIESGREQGVGNVVFRTGSVYELPFDAGTFDAVFSHAVLEHLADPSRALVEFRRVLRSVGIVGVRAPDVRGNLLAPADPSILEAMEMVRRLIVHNGGNWHIGPDTKRLLREAGFELLEVDASYNTFSTFDAVRSWAKDWAQDLAEGADTTRRKGAVSGQLVELGWVRPETLLRWSQAFLLWS